MAKNGKNETELVVALATGQTVRDAAAMAGMSERTAHRRVDDPAFCNRVAAARNEMISQAVGRLSAAATEAVGTMCDLLTSQSERTRLQAAKAILDCGVRLRDASEIAADIERIKKQLKELSQS